MRKTGFVMTWLISNVKVAELPCFGEKKTAHLRFYVPPTA